LKLEASLIRGWCLESNHSAGRILGDVISFGMTFFRARGWVGVRHDTDHLPAVLVPAGASRRSATCGNYLE